MKSPDKTCIHSVTYYKLRFDSRQLEIEDVDILLPPRNAYKDGPIKFLSDKATVPFPIKGIRNVTPERLSAHAFRFSESAEIELVEHAILSNFSENSVRGLLNTPHIVGALSKEAVDDNLGQIFASSDFVNSVKMNCAYLIRLRYTLDLSGEGEELVFCGSIQPSDYFGLRGLFHDLIAHKSVRIVASSAKKRTMLAYCGSNPIAFPTPQPFLEQSSDSGKLFIGKFEFDENLSLDVNRARYFGIHIR